MEREKERPMKHYIMVCVTWADGFVTTARAVGIDKTDVEIAKRRLRELEVK